MTLSAVLIAVLVALAVVQTVPLLPELLLGWTRDRENARGVVLAWLIWAVLVACFVYGFDVQDKPVYRHGIRTPDGYCNHLVNPRDEDGKCDECGGEL